MIRRNQQNLQGIFKEMKSKDLEPLLEMMPHAAALLDIKTKTILRANSKLSELCLYTRSELAGLNLKNLLANWDDNLSSDLDACFTTQDNFATADRLITGTLIRRNQTFLAVQIVCARSAIDNRQALVILEPTDIPGGLSERADLTQIFQAANHLVTVQQETDLRIALNRALAAGSSLTGAKILIVYRAQENAPFLERYASEGPSDLLPERLSAQDLIYLNRPSGWQTGKRPICELQRAARSAQLSYVASAPIGQPNAIIGLAVMADAHLPSPPHLLQAVELLANAVTTILQINIGSEETLSKLHKQETQLQFSKTLEEYTHEGIITLDRTLRISKINLAAEMILGYTNDEVAGQLAERILIGSETLISALTAAQGGSFTLDLGDAHIYRRSGEAFPALLRVFPVLNNDFIDGIIVMIQDLSEHEQIRRHTQQLEHHAILGEVTAVFAHEVRNPINNISTGLQWMAMNLPEDDPFQESIGRMLQDCDRLAELIKSVLAFSRPVEFEMETLDLSLLLKRLLERLRPRIVRQNVQCDLQIESECPSIQGNMRALEQVFNNLITNALQAMHESGGNLVLKVHTIHSPEGHSYVDVSVADTGPGIPKELQDRIFQPFFTTESNGTGLGLAIAKRIVTAHKGNIRLNSFPGGTIFHVQIPVAHSKQRGIQ